jgi:hypothetical protein
MAASRSPGASRARIAGESVAVLIGTAVNGVAAYAYIAVGTRTYGDAAMAPVAVLWTFWAVSVALFTFPIQHWAIRRISVDGDTAGVGGAVPRLSAVAVAVAAAIALAAWLWRGTLFAEGSAGWPLLVFAVMAGSAFTGLQRGVLSGRGRYYATAANIAAENLLRLGLAVVIAAMSDSVLLFATALAFGPLVAVFWPEAVRLPLREPSRESPLGFLGGLAGGILVAQVILNAGPVVLQAIGGSAAAVTGLFLALALFRAPYLLALGVATRATEPLTRLVLSGDCRAVRRVATRIAASSLVAAAAGLAGGYLAGPWLIALVFAPGTPPRAAVVAWIAAGTALALGGLGLVLVLTAGGRTAEIQVAWLFGLVAGAVALLAWRGDPTGRVVAAFVVAELSGWLGLLGFIRRR